MSRTVLAAVPDLFFVARIVETGRTLGVPVEVCRVAELVERSRAMAPALVIVDLHAPGAIEAIGALRADPAQTALPVVGYYAHVDPATRDAALAAGATQVLARSAFTVKLAAILAG